MTASDGAVHDCDERNAYGAEVLGSNPITNVSTVGMQRKIDPLMEHYSLE
jgi:hypothetical protein